MKCICSCFFILFFVFSPLTHSNQCGYLTFDEGVVHAKNIVVAEKLYVGMSVNEFFKSRGDIDINLTKWAQYRKNFDSPEFLVYEVYRGDFSPGDVVKTEGSALLDSFYNIGNKYLLFLDKGGDTYEVDDCSSVDLTRRVALTNFKRYSGGDFDELMKRFELLEKSKPLKK